MLLFFFTWCEFRPERKIFNLPPQKKLSADTLLAPRRPSPPLLGDPPPLMGVSIKNRPPPPGASNCPFLSPDLNRHVHQDNVLFRDNFGESLGVSQTLSKLLESPWTSQNFPELLQKFLGWVIPRTVRSISVRSSWAILGTQEESPFAPQRMSNVCHSFLTISYELSGTGDSQRDSRESIRANHSQLAPLFL